jgi:hypothetical protein
MATDTDAWAQADLIYELSEGVAWLRLSQPERRNAMDHYPGGQGPDGMGWRGALALQPLKTVGERRTWRPMIVGRSRNVLIPGCASHTGTTA